MKKLGNIILLVIIVNIVLINFSSLANPINENKSFFEEKIENKPNNIIMKKNIYLDKENNNEKNIEIINDFGVWVKTNYNGTMDQIKLDIDLVTFKLMIDGGGWRYYRLSLEKLNDSTAGLQFVRTKIYLQEDEEFVNVIEVHFTFETSCNTFENYEVSLEIRFPFSLLKSKAKIINYSILNLLLEQFNYKLLKYIKNKYELLNNPIKTSSESYFYINMGYSSPQNNEGPNRIESRFFFGRNSIFDPRVFRMKITPYDLIKKFDLSYFNSYRTVDEFGDEKFNRTFSVNFEPAVELQITSIPGEGKISYDFGNSGGESTKISFNAIGGYLSNIIQSFIIDPLPEYMSFDLTIIGERQFIYESENKYSVNYMMESIDQGNIVSLELEDLPRKIIAEWGLKLFLSDLQGSGFVDLDMSDDLGKMSLSLVNSENPFIEISNFPRKLRVDGFVNIPNLLGSITASKYLGQQTTINIPLIFDKWEIIGKVFINNGYGYVSFNLPDSNSDHVSLEFDTNNDPLLGLELSVYDLQLDQQILSISVNAIATDDFILSFDYISSEIENLKLSGGITELLDLEIFIDYEGIGFDLITTWILGEYGLFSFQINNELSIDLDQIDIGDIKLNGRIGVYPGTSISVEWNRGNIGYIIFQAQGIEFSPEIELNFLDINSNEVFFNFNIILNPDCILKFDWNWDETGHFTVFTNDIIQDINFEVGYNFDSNFDEFQYGFRLSGSNINVIRTIQWDTENGLIPRIWILGDDPIPGNWDVWLLWNYEWYEVK